MTLAEQLIVVSLLGGLGCWGLSCSQEQRHRQRVEAVASEWLAGIQLARAEAERRQLACGLSLDRGGWQEPVDGSLPACATGLKRFGDAVTLAHSLPATLRFSANGLVIDGGQLIDDMATDGNWDGLGSIDGLGGISSVGEYEFGSTWDMGGVFDVNMRRRLVAFTLLVIDASPAREPMVVALRKPSPHSFTERTQ
jgi:hypothetical protein